jgi:hypothetical protein
MQKINVFMVDRKNGQKIHRYIIPNNNIVTHKQWIIDNCTLPNEPTPCFIDLELPIVIDSPGWYAGKSELWYIEITKSGTIVGYKIGSLFTDKQKAIKILNQKRNSENSKIMIFDVTGRDIPSIDAAQIIISKFEF